MSERPPPFGPGDLVDENYRVVRALGSGGHAHVFEAYDIKLDRTVALKVIQQRSRSGRDLSGRALTEARVLVRIQHPNVVTAHSVGTTPQGHTFVVMEMLQGLSLREILTTFRRLTIPEALELAIQATAGLQAAHEQNVIHRDIKPENLVLVANNQVKILDFGVAKVKGYAAHKTTDRLVVHGTALYMSPEQLQGHEVTVRTDVFSLGVVLYEALYSHPTLLNPEIQQPQQVAWVQITQMPPRLNDLDSEIPRYVSRFVQRALLKNPDERYADMRVMRDAAREVRHRYIAENGEATYRRQIRVLAPQLGRNAQRRSSLPQPRAGQGQGVYPRVDSSGADPPIARANSEGRPLAPGYEVASSFSQRGTPLGVALPAGQTGREREQARVVGAGPALAAPVRKTDVMPILDVSSQEAVSLQAGVHAQAVHAQGAAGAASGRPAGGSVQSEAGARQPLERTLRVADHEPDRAADRESGLPPASEAPDAETNRFSLVEIATTEPNLLSDGPLSERAPTSQARAALGASANEDSDLGYRPALPSASAPVRVATERLTPAPGWDELLPAGVGPAAETRTARVSASPPPAESAASNGLLPGQLRTVDRSRLKNASGSSSALASGHGKPARQRWFIGSPWKALGLAGLASGVTFGVGFELTQRVTQQRMVAEPAGPNASIASPSSEVPEAVVTTLHASDPAGPPSGQAPTAAQLPHGDGANGEPSQAGASSSAADAASEIPRATVVRSTEVPTPSEPHRGQARHGKPATATTAPSPRSQTSQSKPSKSKYDRRLEWLERDLNTNSKGASDE